MNIYIQTLHSLHPTDSQPDYLQTCNQTTHRLAPRLPTDLHSDYLGPCNQTTHRLATGLPTDLHPDYLQTCNWTTYRLKQKLRKPPYICCTMNPDTLTPHIPGQHYDKNAHSTIDPQVPPLKANKTVLQPVLDTSLFPALPNPPFRTSEIRACTCHDNGRSQITSRPNPPHGSPHVVGLSTMRNKSICPVHTNSTAVYLTGPSGTGATVQRVASYNHATQTPQNHKGEEELPAPLLPLNPRNAPWSSELAHIFPSSERFAALKVMLNDLEPSLNLVRWCILPKSLLRKQEKQ